MALEPPTHDVTGLREWDCSRLLLRLLQNQALLTKPPARVIELGAGTGSLAVALAASWGRTLCYYAATDQATRLPQLRERIEREGPSAASVSAVELTWGEPAEAAFKLEDVSFDLVLCSELLYWNGASLFESDTLEPLVTTLVSLLGAHTVALCAYRERILERESHFIDLCCARGLVVSRVSESLVAAEAPTEPMDPITDGDGSGALVVLQITVRARSRE